MAASRENVRVLVGSESATVKVTLLEACPSALKVTRLIDGDKVSEMPEPAVTELALPLSGMVRLVSQELPTRPRWRKSK